MPHPRSRFFITIRPYLERFDFSNCSRSLFGSHLGLAIFALHLSLVLGHCPVPKLWFVRFIWLATTQPQPIRHSAVAHPRPSSASLLCSSAQLRAEPCSSAHWLNDHARSPSNRRPRNRYLCVIALLAAPLLRPKTRSPGLFLLVECLLGSWPHANLWILSSWGKTICSLCSFS